MHDCDFNNTWHTQGPPGTSFEVMVSLFNCVPRDADHTAELWTTVNKKNDNVREKAVYKLLPGFSLYLTLMAKNFTYESKMESRYRLYMNCVGVCVCVCVCVCV